MKRRDVLRAALAAVVVPLVPVVPATPVREIVLLPNMMVTFPKGWTVNGI